MRVWREDRGFVRTQMWKQYSYFFSTAMALQSCSDATYHTHVMDEEEQWRQARCSDAFSEAVASKLAQHRFDLVLLFRFRLTAWLCMAAAIFSVTINDIFQAVTHWPHVGDEVSLYVFGCSARACLQFVYWVHVVAGYWSRDRASYVTEEQPNSS